MNNPLSGVDSLLRLLGLGKTSGNVNLATMAPTAGKLADQTNQQVTDTFAKQQQILAAAKAEKDPQKKMALIQQSRALDQGLSDSTDNLRDFTNLTQQRGNVSDANLKDSNLGFALKRGAQQSAELGSYAVPFGKGANLLTRVLLPGAAAAGLSKLAEDDANLGNVTTAAAGGAAGAGLLHGAGSLLSKATGGVADRLMNSVFKEPLKATRAAIKTGEGTLGEQAAEKGFKGLTNEGIYKNAVGEINNLEDQLQQKLTNSDATVPLKSIKEGVSSLIKKYADAGNTGAVSNITNRLDALEKQHGEAIPVALANEVKRTLYDEARNAYGQTASEALEGVKGIARALKEGIAGKVQGVDEINKGLSYQGKIADSMADKLARGGRNNLLGLTQGVLGAGGLAAAGSTGGLSLLPAALQGILGSTPGKVLSAQGLQGISNAVTKAGETPALQQAAGQTVSRLGGALSNLLGNVGKPGEVQAYGNEQDQQSPSPENLQGGNQQTNNQTQQVTPPLTGSPVDQLKQFNVPDKNIQEFLQFAQQNGVNVGAATGSQRQAPGKYLNPYGQPPEALYQESYKALAAGDKKTAANLMQMYEDETKYQKAHQPDQGKAVSSATLQVRGKATSGLQATQNIQSLLDKNPNLLANAKIPLPDLLKGQDRKLYDSAVSSLTDAIGGLRTGASVSKEQQEFYKNMLPKAGDSPQTIKSKLAAVNSELQGYVQTNVNDNNQSDILNALAAQGINLQ